MMQRFAEALFVIGLLTYTYAADFERYEWQVTYSFWDKGKDLLLFYLLSRQRFRPVVWLCLLRVAWEFVSMCTGININESWIVSILFIIYCLYVLSTTAKNVRN